MSNTQSFDSTIDSDEMMLTKIDININHSSLKNNINIKKNNIINVPSITVHDISYNIGNINQLCNNYEYNYEYNYDFYKCVFCIFIVSLIIVLLLVYRNSY
jgi:hypothetical protein